MCFRQTFCPSSGVQDCTYSPDDGWKDGLKHVESYSKQNKFETLVHLVGFTVEIYYDAQSYERQMFYKLFSKSV